MLSDLWVSQGLSDGESFAKAVFNNFASCDSDSYDDSWMA